MNKNPFYPRSQWRLIVETQPRHGAMNLAIDEGLLRSYSVDQCPTTLRLYQWSPPALTLGRGQRVSDVDIEAVNEAGLTLIRRMTGGTAVLNDIVLSYAVIAADDDCRFAGSIPESYRGISQALTTGLRMLGLAKVEAKAMDPVTKTLNRDERSPVCFEIPSHYEITVEGRKLVGSSQMRSRGGILQHGSLYLDGDIGEISRFLSSHPDPNRIRSRTLTLRDAIGRTLTFDEVAQAFMQSFDEALNVQLTPGNLSPSEQSEFQKILSEKYGNRTWTNRL